METTHANAKPSSKDYLSDPLNNESLTEKEGNQHFEVLQKELRETPPLNAHPEKGSASVQRKHFKEVKQEAETSQQRQGISIAVKIFSSMGMLTLIIMIISGIMLMIMDEIRTEMTFVVNPAIANTKLAEQMSLTLYEILLLEEKYTNTENAFLLTAISQELERLKTQLAESSKLAKYIEQYIAQKLSGFFIEMEGLLNNHINDAQAIGQTIQDARKANQEVVAETKKAKDTLLGSLGKVRQMLSTTVEDHWIQLKRRPQMEVEAITLGQALVSLEEQAMNLQFEVLEFTTSENKTLSGTIRQHGQDFINMSDRLRTTTSDEKLQVTLNELKKELQQFLSLFNNTVELIEQRTQAVRQNKEFIDEKKKSLLTSANLLLSSFDQTRERTWGRIEANSQMMDDLSSNSIWILSILAGFGILLGVLVLIFVPRPIINTIRELLDASSAIAQGDLTQPIESNSKDELGALARQMEQMRKNLLTLIRGISEAVLNTASLSNEIMASTNQQNSSSTEMASQVNQIMSSINEQVSSMSEMDQSLKGISQFSMNSVEKSRESVEQAQIALEGMENIDQANAEAGQRIQVLREKIEEISKVLGVISEVADQTNLLSLNASIESTKAGEAGKGFSVVAGEIRRLADRSMLATQNINDIVHDIQRASESTVMSMQKSSEEIRVGSDSVKITVVNLQEIVDNITQTSTQTEDMTKAVGQQTETTRVIGDSMQNISSATNMSANSSREIVTAISDLNTMVSQLRDSIARFNTN